MADWTKLGDKAIEGMLDLLRRGYAWDYVAKRYQVDESQARRAVRAYQRRQRERGDR